MTLMLLAAAGMIIALAYTHTLGSYDAIILTFISVVYCLGALFMIGQTRWRDWTILGSGLVATFTADALVYGLFASNLYREGNDRIPFYQEGLVIARSLFVVGGTWVIIGMLVETWLLFPPETQERFKAPLRKLVRRRKTNA